MQYTLKHGTQKQNKKKNKRTERISDVVYCKYIYQEQSDILVATEFDSLTFFQLFCYNWTIQIIIAQSPERARNQFAYNKWDFVVAKSPIMLLNKHWCPKCCRRVTVSRVSSPDWRNFKPKICRSSLLNQPNKK